MSVNARIAAYLVKYLLRLRVVVRDTDDTDDTDDDDVVLVDTQHRDHAEDLRAAYTVAAQSFIVPAGPLDYTQLYNSALVRHLIRALGSLNSYHAIYAWLERALAYMASVYCSGHFDTDMSRVAVLSMTITILNLLPGFHCVEQERRSPSEQQLLRASSMHGNFLHLFIVLALLDHNMDASYVMELPPEGSVARTEHLNCFLNPLAVTLTFEGKHITSIADAFTAIGVRRVALLPPDVVEYCNQVFLHRARYVQACAQRDAAMSAPAA